MKKYDYAIIGAGIAGSSISHFLHKNKAMVALIDKDGICSASSSAAGAFLSPLPGKKNPYNSFINEALEFSLNFYDELLGDEIVKHGVLRVANEHFDATKLSSCDAVKMKFQNAEGYFYDNAAIADPQTVCKKLTENIDFYKMEVMELVRENGFYLFNGFKAKNIVLAQGVYKELVEMPYINITAVFGVKIDVHTTTDIPFNIHKSISISTNKKDKTVAIGATKERHIEVECNTTCDKCPFYNNQEEQQAQQLLNEAQELVELENVNIARVYRGARATMSSYFPTIGDAINYDESLKKYPSIKNGTKIPPEMLIKHENIYIINGVGSRGFVVSPYLAKLLSDALIHKAKLPKELVTSKLFYKKAREKSY